LNAAAPDFVEGILARGREPKPALIEEQLGKGNIVTDTESRQEGVKDARRSPRHALHVQVEEIEDEYWAMEASMPKAKIGLIEDAIPEEDAVDARIEDEEEMGVQKEAEVIGRTPLPPPLEEAELIVIPPRRNPKSGDSALGVSVLSVKGWIGSLDDTLVDLRLDSCADITLISEETHAVLTHPPRIRQGHRMSLAQLTDKGTTIKGYTKLPIIMRTMSGELIMLEAEAYVVKGMTVPILLGEDFQINYELGVIRNVETGSKIIWRNLPYEVEAEGVEPYPGQPQVHVLATGLSTHARSLSKAKEHRRAKARRRRKAMRAGAEAKLVRAAQDYRIRAHECKMVAVEGNFSSDKEWLVERNLLANAEDSFFSIPNTLIS
jgi:hypothetical protein